MYPEYAEINGKEYKIDTDFTTALKCFEVIEDENITDYERAFAIVYLLFDFIPENNENINLFLEKAKIFLECGEEKNKKNKSSKKDMDFFQDRSLINSSFMSDYHIDLSKEKIHFWRFIELLEGLTENSSLNRVRELRNFDISKIKDMKEKEKIIKAKREVALKENKNKPTEEQKERAIKFYKMLGL